ncbi:MAG: DMT family transporter [Pseudomonadota bacterium]
MAEQQVLRSGARTNAAFWLVMLLCGLAWGSTQLFSKLVVNAGHHPVGISFTGTVLGAVALAALLIVRGQSLPLTRRHLIFYAVCGLTGTALPHVLGYTGMQHLPVGVMSIVIAMVPIMTYLGAIIIRMERLDGVRSLGLIFGAVAVLFLVVPDASLPEPEKVAWLALPLLTSLCYTIENLYIGRAQPRDIDPMQTMCGLFWAALLLLLPAVFVSGEIMMLGAFDLAELSLIAMTACHVGAYAGFVWLISRAGPVFAAQVGYVVTLAGVFLGIIVLGEQNSIWVWASLIVMMLGLALVQPRERT